MVFAVHSRRTDIDLEGADARPLAVRGGFATLDAAVVYAATLFRGGEWQASRIDETGVGTALEGDALARRVADAIAVGSPKPVGFDRPGYAASPDAYHPPKSPSAGASERHSSGRKSRRFRPGFLRVADRALTMLLASAEFSVSF